LRIPVSPLSSALRIAASVAASVNGALRRSSKFLPGGSLANDVFAFSGRASGYVVRGANGRRSPTSFSRDNEAEAQAQRLYARDLPDLQHNKLMTSEGMKGVSDLHRSQRQRQWNPTFSQYSYGFRPRRSAHHAVAVADRAPEVLERFGASVV
jgi:hypothetical protein